jgi:UDP-2,3-diacylglucosamine pyrophosphatase LpxH
MQKKFLRLYEDSVKPENRLPLDPARDRYVIFSDHHKGDGSAADDFLKNSGLYAAALTHYAAGDYRLLVLGDNEELWENTFDQVRARHGGVIAREIVLAPQGKNRKRVRIWGNHDKEVSLRGFQRRMRRSKDNPFAAVDLRESLCLGPDIFLIHGHQGRFFEDKAWRISRWAVHFFWKTIQKILHIGIDGPAENVDVREDLEMQYYRWAEAHRVVLICGHTHRAVFASQTHYDRLRREIERLEREPEAHSPDRREVRRRRLDALRRERRRMEARHGGKAPRSFADPPDSALPCYFNDGCCGYTNGITCIEIAEGEIRLVKWQRSPRERQVLVRDGLERIIRHVRSGTPLPDP